MLAVGLAVGSHWVVEPVRVTSDSMSPTLSAGDHVILLRTPWAGTVSRGDVVVVGPGWAERAASTTNAGAQVPTGTSWVKHASSRSAATWSASRTGGSSSTACR